MNDDDGLTLTKVDVLTQAFLGEQCGINTHTPFTLEMHRQDGTIFGGCDFPTFAAVAQFLDHMSPVRFEIFCGEEESGEEIERLLKEISRNAVH